jgi:hypothetical protein
MNRLAFAAFLSSSGDGGLPFGIRFQKLDNQKGAGKAGKDKPHDREKDLTVCAAL